MKLVSNFKKKTTFCTKKHDKMVPATKYELLVEITMDSYRVYLVELVSSQMKQICYSTDFLLIFDYPSILRLSALFTIIIRHKLTLKKIVSLYYEKH